MIRLIVRTVSAIPAGDWPTEVELQSFDILAPEVEAYLRGKISYGSRAIIGGHPVEGPDPDDSEGD
jgi:hypothetical protein